MYYPMKLQSVYNSIGCVMDSLLVLSVVECAFKSCSGQTSNYENWYLLLPR